MNRLSESIAQLRHNPQQAKAFETQGHCVVLAPPGSGKTKLLTTRLAYDLFNTIPSPHGAACITLTNAAADELRRRLDVLVPPGRSSLFVGTVHSFALRRVIAPFAAVAGRPDLARASIGSDAQINGAYEEAIGAVFGSRADTRHIRSTIEFHRKRLSSDDQWSRSGHKTLAAARKYEAKLAEQELIDFDGVVAAAVELVEKHELVRRALIARFPCLYVDEYQDLAPGLDRLVRAMCFGQSGSATLFTVGDPEQAVFGWTGSRPELLAELAGLPDVTAVPLEINYRCGKEIIRVADRVRKGTSPVVGQRDGGHVSVNYCPDGFAGQCRSVVAAVRNAVADDVALHEIVVICLRNDQCKRVAETLRASNIPAFVRGAEYRQSTSTAFVEACAAWSTLDRERSNYRLADLLGQWRNLVGPMWTREQDVALAELLMSLDSGEQMTAHDLLERLLELGLARGLQRPSMSDEALILAEMKKSLTEGALVGLTIKGLAERARKVDRVEVTTMTSSKGLEFDVVLIVGLDDKGIPHFKSIYNPAELAEDRRKFYVSITRARNQVHMFYSEFVEWASGKTTTAGPSRFLSEAGLL
ncbi:ATP-dependent helicase [Saccharopolyspora indica]|uniref:UvrD-helicase domain-containing protein n=1 Tax=Saccharopolyspora indica TaxID=1229659 RepID=UPI0022EADC48|nr:ATP-dependent helicase [Saccharopolyspora indica]MDA3646635.1 ATP-dependent helicase [Saccharopolyspora indica]